MVAFSFIPSCPERGIEMAYEFLLESIENTDLCARLEVGVNLSDYEQFISNPDSKFC